MPTGWDSPFQTIWARSSARAGREGLEARRARAAARAAVCRVLNRLWVAIWSYAPKEGSTAGKFCGRLEVLCRGRAARVREGGEKRRRAGPRSQDRRLLLQQPLEALHVLGRLVEKLARRDRDDRVAGRGTGRVVPGLDRETETLSVLRVAGEGRQHVSELAVAHRAAARQKRDLAGRFIAIQRSHDRHEMRRTRDFHPCGGLSVRRDLQRPRHGENGDGGLVRLDVARRAGLRLDDELERAELALDPDAALDRAPRHLRLLRERRGAIAADRAQDRGAGE